MGGDVTPQAARFVVCYATAAGDAGKARLHAYADGDGSLRDNNHAAEIVREFARGNEGAIVMRPPQGDERAMFEVVLCVSSTRRGTSTYFGCDYRQIQPCPHCVAAAGMEIYEEIKRVLKRARKRKEGRNA